MQELDLSHCSIAIKSMYYLHSLICMWTQNNKRISHFYQDTSWEQTGLTLCMSWTEPSSMKVPVLFVGQQQLKESSDSFPLFAALIWDTISALAWAIIKMSPENHNDTGISPHDYGSSVFCGAFQPAPLSLFTTPPTPPTPPSSPHLPFQLLSFPLCACYPAMSSSLLASTPLHRPHPHHSHSLSRLTYQ